MEPDAIADALRKLNVQMSEVLQILPAFVTKDDARGLATKVDLLETATRAEFAELSTREPFARMATKDDLRDLATKDDLLTLASKEELVATRETLRLEIRENSERSRAYAKILTEGVLARLDLFAEGQVAIGRPAPSPDV